MPGGRLPVAIQARTSRWATTATAGPCGASATAGAALVPTHHRKGNRGLRLDDRVEERLDAEGAILDSRAGTGQALLQRGRPVLRLQLGADRAAGLRHLRQALGLEPAR